MQRTQQTTGQPGGRTYPGGAVIARSGDPGDEMYVILRGSVSLFSGYQGPAEACIATLGAGDFFGEAGPFLGKNHGVTAVAVTDTAVLVINRGGIADFFRTQPDAAFSLALSMARRLDQQGLMLESLRPQPPAPAAKADAKTVVLGGEPGPKKAPSAPRAPVFPRVEAAAPAAPAPTPQASAPKAAPPPPQQAAPAAPAPTPNLTANAVEGAAIIGPAHGPSVFLPGHREYRLPLETGDGALFFDKSMACPQCGQKFTLRAVKQSKLVTARTDPDRRVRYKNVEPLYYDIAICPQCWFSATVDSFATGARRAALLKEALAPFRSELALPQPPQIDETAVFAGHYMAIACAPLCYPGPYIVQGKLWQKLSRIYSDCGDRDMELAAAERAFSAYMTAYTTTNVSPRQNQQLCVIIAELAFKRGDLKEARNFFFKAKTDPAGTPELKRHAEDRIEDIRSL